MINISVYFYSMLLPTAIPQRFCSMSTSYATFYWTQCLYELLGPHNNSNPMSEKPAVFPQTQVTGNYPYVSAAKLVQIISVSCASQAAYVGRSIIGLMVISMVINTLRTGLLNCLNARSRGLIQSEVRFL